MLKMQVLRTYYNDAQMTDSNSLANALMERPTELSPIITHLAGKEDRKFPVTMLTEGVGNTKSIDRWEYEYRVKTHEVNVRPLVVAASSADGASGAPFTLTFPDKWFIFPYTLISANGTQARIMSEPVAAALGVGYDYSCQLVEPGSAGLAAGDFELGANWAQMYANVGLDFSRGNASNWSAPGMVRNKIGTVRKSYHFAGNAKDYVAEFSLPVKGGKTTKLWMDYEEYTHMLRFKEECELMYWYGEMSYDANGLTTMVDENAQPVITGPGLLQQIVNKDTYSTLTETKLKNVLGDLFYGMTDGNDKQVTLFTGTGGMREFDNALKNYQGGFTHNSTGAGTANWTVNADSKFITGSGRSLGMTGYFTRYDHIDGHSVNVVKHPMFDHGPVADAASKHPTTGYSMESYRMVFVDQSNYDGQPNLQMINKKGRELLRWAVGGSVVPRGFDQGNARASDIDGASVHMLKTAGIILRRFDTSLDITCTAS